MAGASDIKFGTQLGFAKADDKITCRRKGSQLVMALGQGCSPKFGVPFNIYTIAEASDFKFGTQLGFAKTHHKTSPRGAELLVSIHQCPFFITRTCNYTVNYNTKCSNENTPMIVKYMRLK